MDMTREIETLRIENEHLRSLLTEQRDGGGEGG